MNIKIILFFVFYIIFGGCVQSSYENANKDIFQTPDTLRELVKDSIKHSKDTNTRHILSKRTKDTLIFSKKIKINQHHYNLLTIYEGDRKFIEYQPVDIAESNIRYELKHGELDTLFDINGDKLMDFIMIKPTTGPQQFNVHLSQPNGLLLPQASIVLYDYKDLGEGHFLEITSHRCPSTEIQYKHWEERTVVLDKICYLSNKQKYFCFPKTFVPNCLKFDNIDKKTIQKYQTSLGHKTKIILIEKGLKIN